GGDYQGGGGAPRAQTTIVDAGASIVADATVAGNGGTVVVWADDATRFNGTISARGGDMGGDGGQVETSGKVKLSVTTGSVDVGAKAGEAGTWLLDPNDLTIKNNGGVNTNVSGSFATTNDAAVLDTGVLGAALTGGANVIVLTSSGGTNAQSGTITVQNTTTAALAVGQSATLTLAAQGSIVFDANATISKGSGNALNVNLHAGTTSTGVAPGTNPSTITMNASSKVEAGTGVVTAESKGNVQLGGIVAGGLQVKSNNGAVTQTGVLDVTGTSTVNAGTGDITLAQAGNNFGSIGLTGGAISVADGTGGLTVTGVNNGANKAVSLISTGGTLTLPATAIATGTADLTLESAGTLATAAALSGGNVSLKGNGGITLSHNVTVTASGTLGLTSTNSAINQTGGALDAAEATVKAGTGDITLAQADNKLGDVALMGGAIKVVDSTGGLNVTSLTRSGGADKALELRALGGGVLTLPVAVTNIDTGTAYLTLVSSGGTLAPTGDLSGGNVSLTGGTGITLSKNVKASGTLGLASSNSAINQTGGAIDATGATTVNAGAGDVTLAQAGNNFGSIGLTGGAISVVDGAGGLTVTGLSSVADKAVSLVSTGGALTLPATAIATGTADLTLESVGTLATAAALSGANVSLTGTGGITLGHNVTASGTLGLTSTNNAINQTGGAVAATGTSTVNAGTGGITLAQAGNDFGGAVTLTGGATQIKDGNALTLGTLSTGALTVEANAGGGTADLNLGKGTVASLDAKSNGGAIKQSTAAVGDTLTVTGTSTVNAGTGDITLAQAGNNFGSIGLTGGAISVADGTGGLTVTGVSSGANKAVSLVSTGGTLTLPGTAINTGTANLTLQSAGTLATAAALSGANVSLTGTGGITL
ncbi:MAG: beta strand repeat-containing protein, partial [Betaproteobacteria bacterium]